MKNYAYSELSELRLILQIHKRWLTARPISREVSKWSSHPPAASSSPGGLTQTVIALTTQPSPSRRLVWFTLYLGTNLAAGCLLNPVGRSRHPAAARGGTKRVANEIICCREAGGAMSSSSKFACF
jgi:hypothetical protein